MADLIGQQWVIKEVCRGCQRRVNGFLDFLDRNQGRRGFLGGQWVRVGRRIGVVVKKVVLEVS